MNSPDFDPGDLHHNSSGDTPDGGTGTPGAYNRKRKAATASGRGVASLTPEQLAKKRANDREAQRAIRERTKGTIESLERRIHDLTSQQPYQELQNIIRQKEAVQAENEDIRRRLASVVTILQPLLAPQGLSELAQAAQHTVQTGLSQQSAVFQPDQFINAAPLPPRSLPPPSAASESGNYPSPFPSSEHDPNSEALHWRNQRVALNNQRESMHRNHELSENGERLNFSFLIDANAPNKNGYIPSTPDRRHSPSDRYAPYPDHTSTTQAWNMLPKNCPPTCPLDHILINFLKARQNETASYTSNPSHTPTYQSPAYPSISNLLNPTKGTTSTGTASPSIGRHIHHARSPATSSSHLSQPDPISTLMTDIISKFPNINSLPEQVATTYTMFLMMRWQIYPTQENYDRLPEWLQPRPSQLFTPHPAWVEHVCWPRMRDKVVREHEKYPFEHWFLPFTSGLSVNWPYEPVDCLISTSEEEDPVINPVFERHIRRLENWSVGPGFIEAFPALADTTIVRERLGGKEIAVPLDGNGVPLGLSAVGDGIAIVGLHQQGHQGGQ